MKFTCHNFIKGRSKSWLDEEGSFLNGQHIDVQEQEAKNTRRMQSLVSFGKVLFISIILAASFHWSIFGQCISFFSWTGNDPKEILEVSGPLPDYGVPVATQVLMNYTFGNSYGHPYTGSYAPPDVEFTHVQLFLEGNTYGTQFDRLGHIFIGGSEIWRTSTPEPAKHNITWHNSKDVSAYTSLFKSPQDLVFLLNNVVDANYTGPLSINLVADYFNVPVSIEECESISETYSVARHADRIKSFSSSGGSVYAYPEDEITITLDGLPRNTTKAVLDIFASGNSQEEFWYTHLFNEYYRNFPPEFVEGGHGPYRLVQAFVNDHFAGFSFLFPIIYTGGISPGLWNPIVGINAYDVPSYQVDITPFLPLLWEGGATIRISMSNGIGKESPSTDNNWLINANILTWEVNGIYGSGQKPIFESQDHYNKIGSNSRKKPSVAQILSASQTLYSANNLTFSGQSPEDETLEYVWNQAGHFSSVQSVSTTKQDVVQSSTLSNYVKINSLYPEYFNYSYPLVLSTKSLERSDEYETSIVRAYSIVGNDYFRSSGQNGSSKSIIRGNRYYGGPAKMETRYQQGVGGGPIFKRHARADNGILTWDHTYEGHDKFNHEYPDLTMQIESAANAGLSGQSSAAVVDQLTAQIFGTDLEADEETISSQMTDDQSLPLFFVRSPYHLE